MATCKFCKEEIDWAKEDGKWTPYNYDGTRHSHPKKDNEGSKANYYKRSSPKQEAVTNADLLQVLNRIDLRLKRLVELAEDADSLPFEPSVTG